MKIAHLADTHVKTLQNHNEYRAIFNQIYEKLRSEKVDYIVHCGDIVHSKTQISPELVDMVSHFLNSLAEIAPTIVILGNHDGNLNNSDRQDAISPIVSALGRDNLYLIKNCGEVIDTKNRIVFNGLSIFDEKNWKKPSQPDYINIALYHGCISGCKTDTGYVMEKGDHDSSIFEGFDYAFLGDIHTTNQILDTEGKVRYPGSTVQQNFAESNDKGFLIWNIQSKDKFTCEHISIKNPHPFVTIELDEDGNLPNIEIEKSSRVRIYTNKNITLEKVKKAKDIIKNNYSPLSITYLNKPNSTVFNEKNALDVVSKKKTLRDISFQEQLIVDFLKGYKPNKELLSKIFDLNKKFNTSAGADEEIGRNINWKIKKFSWDNLFNYGDNNSINFSNLNGVVGIFGKNYSGKSSIIDGLLYTIFNTTSKNNRKNLNVINQNKEKGIGKVEVEINGEDYTIQRISEKYTKKTKGVEITEAKTEVEFTSTSESFNGLDRNDTDKNIRKYFGTVDDFFLTSMATQFGYLSFVSEGSTKRKEILAKFLDLDIFEKKFKLAKEESAELKALLKKLEGNNFDKDIEEAQKNLYENDNSIIEQQKVLENLKNEIEGLNFEIKALKDKMNSTPIDAAEYFKLHNALVINKKNLANAQEKTIQLQQEKTRLETLISKLDEFAKQFNEKELLKNDAELDKIKEQMIPLEKEISALEANIKGYTHKLKLLDDIPCGNQFTSCKFIKDAFQAKEKMSTDEGTLLERRNYYNGIDARYNELDEKTAYGLNKLGEIAKKKRETEEKRLENELNISDNLLFIEKTKAQIEKDQESFDKQEKDRAIIEKLDEMKKETKKLESLLTFTKASYAMNEESLVNMYKFQGSTKQKVETLTKQKAELEKIRQEYTAYELYLKCMHPNGISYEIIKQKLPEINAEIAKILNNIVDFTVFLENDDDKLDIVIKHQNCESRPLEMGSGAEKTLASVAIRLALLSVTSLPTSDIFVMDEPGTALDENNLQGFIKMLDMIKNYFKTVLIISHLDALKECVDRQIIINDKNGYAFVEET